jgi:PAS domain S-box-containing protein
MIWLPSALIATVSIGSLVALVYLYIYYQEREPALALWAASWATYNLRFLIHLGLILQVIPAGMIIAQQFFSIIGSFLFVLGTHRFLQKKLSFYWPIAAAACLAWFTWGHFNSISFFTLDFPVSLFIGFAFGWSGYLILRGLKTPGFAKYLVGWSLIAWGIHKVDYPFLRPILWFAPWGYLIAAWLFLLAAVSLILLYYEKIRSALQQEIRKREESEGMLNAIFNQAKDGILVADARTKRFLTGNKTICGMLGYSPEEIKNLGVGDIHPKEHLPGVIEIFDRQATREIELAPEVPVIRKDGTIFFADIKASPARIGDKTYLIGIFRDVSEKKDFEEKVRKTQRLEAIGTLAGGIAHDFNNILSAILGYTDLALTELPPDTALYQYLQEVLKAGNRAKDLIKQILTFSRKTATEFIPIQAQSIVKEALKLLRATIPTTIEIRESIDSACPPIMADPSQIHQVVMNICTNAYHALENTGGRLEVDLREIKVTEKSPPGKTLIWPGRYLRLNFHDNGPGMKKEIMDHIFEPYFTTKGKEKGTGLGLAVVHGIVIKHNGMITVESEPGRGTTFSLYFPIVENESAPQLTVQNAIPTGKERILFIDDEQTLVLLARQMLESLGYKATCMTSSSEGFKTFQQDPQGYDLVITDQTMPILPGSELAQRILAIRPDMPIILCTGYSSMISEQKAKQLGIREFLLKPIERRKLAETIRRALDG